MNLDKRALDVIEVLKRYGVATPKFLDEKVPGGSGMAAKLHRSGYLKWVRISKDEFAYVLTEHAIDTLGLSTLFPMVDPKNYWKCRYAMMKFCERDPQRMALTPWDFEATPQYAYPHIDHRSYYQHGNVLGKLLVDCGKKETSWNRLRRRFKESALQHLSRPAFATLAEAGRLEVAAVTPHKSKANTLKRLDKQHEIRKQVPLRVEHIPELAPF